MDKKKETAEVIEILPNGHVRLRLDAGNEIMAYMAGRMSHARVKVIIGDKVTVELDKYGGKVSNRVIRRL